MLNKERTKKRRKSRKIIQLGKKSFGNDIALLVSFSVLVLSFINLANSIRGFPLISPFDETLQSLHKFCHQLLDTLVFSWLTHFLRLIIWVLTLTFPVLIIVIPPWENIVIPSIYADISLLSIALTRVFYLADIIVPREKRTEAEKTTTAEQWEQIRKAEGKFWGPIHRFLEKVNKIIWAIFNNLYHVLRFLIICIPNVKKPFVIRWTIFKTKKILKGYIGLLLQIILSSAAMWGFIRLGGYTINVVASRKVIAPVMEVRQKLFRHFVLFLIGALLATIGFFWANGYLYKFR